MSSVFRGILQRPYDIHLTYNDIQRSSKAELVGVFSKRQSMVHFCASLTGVTDSLDFIQRLKLLEKLPVHSGCVNTLSWNDTGELLLSGSDDQHLAITHGASFKVLISVLTRHKANIFSAKFLPNSGDHSVVSCSGNGLVIYTPDIERPDGQHENCFSCHVGTAYKVVTIPNDGNVILSCGEDGMVRCFDVRIKTSCTVNDCRKDMLINCGRSVTALAVDPFMPCQLAVGCCDSFVGIYDRRMIGTNHAPTSNNVLAEFTVPGFEDRSHRITSIVYSSKGDDLLVSYSADYVYLFCLKGDIDKGLGNKSLSMSSSRNCVPRKPKDPLAIRRPMKKMRLRGDWSDTGPNARPEREIEDSAQQQAQHQLEPRQLEPPSARDNLTRHLSDVLTHWMLNEPLSVEQQQQQQQEQQPQQQEQQQQAQQQQQEQHQQEQHQQEQQQPINEGRVDSVPAEYWATRSHIMSDSDFINNEFNMDEDYEQSSSQDAHRPGNSGRTNADDPVHILLNMEDAIAIRKQNCIVNEIQAHCLNQPTVQHKYVGHRNSRTMIKEANFWGDKYVMSGSDCGHVFMWNRYTCELVMIMEADSHVVNCLQPHPFDPILATSGIDYDVKLWAPTCVEPQFDTAKANEIMSRNKVMLEETSNTITVPASFMVRMLASSISRVRQGGIVARWRHRVHLNRSNSNLH